ncbi:hypothetical protein BaRGS_00022492, partial [Batillaria attramentaria]
MRFKPMYIVILSGYLLCVVLVNMLCGFIRAREKVLESPTSSQVTFSRIRKFTNDVRPKRCNGCFNSVFPMLIDEEDICKTHHDQGIELVFLIVSSHLLRKRRDSIRQTWASITKNNTSRYRHVFLFGATRRNALMEIVREESRQFRDVLVSDFLDSYDNLTLKTLMGLRWAATRCRHARFFMKVDDDVWVNTVALRKMLTRKGELLDNSLTGMCRNGTVIVRDPHSK